MDQLKSSNRADAAQMTRRPEEEQRTPPSESIIIPLPKRSFTVEFMVGVFTLLGVLAFGYLAVGLGDINVMGAERYEVNAEFDNIAGLKTGASVEIAGVEIGEVVGIQLKDPAALVTMSIDSNVKLRDDDIASIRTKGIIGDRYVKVSRGGSDKYLNPHDTLTETESVVDIEDLIGKFIHNLGGDKEE